MPLLNLKALFPLIGHQSCQENSGPLLEDIKSSILLRRFPLAAAALEQRYKKENNENEEMERYRRAQARMHI